MTQYLTTNCSQGSMNGIDSLSKTKVSIEDSVLVLSKLSLIINNGKRPLRTRTL